MTKHQFPSDQNETYDDEISLRDIVNFLKDSWQLIVKVGIIGALVGIAFLLLMPVQYEATAQIQVSQLGPKGNGRDSVNPIGANVEDPAILIARFKLPSTYSEVEIKACQIETKNPLEDLADLIKITSVKGSNSVIELKIRRTSPELAKNCTLAIFEKIRDTQKLIKEPFLEEARSKMTSSQSQLLAAKDILKRADKSGEALSASYLSTRDEERMLQEEILDLQDFINAGDMRNSKLISPIYAPNIIIFPKKILTLLLAIAMGLFLGVLTAVSKKTWKSYQSPQSRR